MRGVPLRLEVGPRDVTSGVVTASRRDIPGKEGKLSIPQTQLTEKIESLLLEIHESLYHKALAFRDSHIFEPKNYDDMKEILSNGWAYTWWCGSRECEEKIKEDTKATTRCIPLGQTKESGKCIYCGKPASEKIYFAKAY